MSLDKTVEYPPSEAVAGKTHIACPCGKSSDAYTEYTDGHGFCFSCGKRFQENEESSFSTGSEHPEGSSIQSIDFREIPRNISDLYKVKTLVSESGEVLQRLYTYHNGGVKTRHVANKQFSSVGLKGWNGVFGLDLFDPGSKRSITIVEGEEDALSAYYALKEVSAVVSVQSSSTALKDCQADREKINSFDRIYLCFDNDVPGQKAAEQVASLFDFNKVYHVQLSKYKDANEYLLKKDQDGFRNAWYAAKRYIPEGIVSTYDDFKEILDDKEGDVLCTYPHQELQRMFRGIREGEIVLLDAPEGIGKTEFLRWLEYHILTTTEHNLGIIHLEEPKKRLLQGLAGLFMKEPIHFNKDISNEEVLEVLRSVTKRDNRLHLYSHFGSDDPNIIIDRIRFMVSVLGCKIVTLDHITMVVTGLDTDDERRALDQLSTRLAMLCQELNFALILISHINDDGQTRGSRNISKIAHARISLKRDIEAIDPTERNTTTFLVKKKDRKSVV